MEFVLFLAVLEKSVHMEKNLIAPCSQVHDNFTMGVNRKTFMNLIYLFYPRNISYVCKPALIIYYLPIIDM